MTTGCYINDHTETPSPPEYRMNIFSWIINYPVLSGKLRGLEYMSYQYTNMIHLLDERAKALKSERDMLQFENIELKRALSAKSA